ncbi:MAG: PilT/PilU family type 4a pilus ATPase [Opitutaceae bacterium]|jgi:twitching motility protein PilT
MTTEVLWLARLGIDQGLFTQIQALTVARAVGAKAEVMDFAQKLIDDGIVEDVDKLERIAGLALEKAKSGDPASNPFVEEAPPAEGESPAGKPAISPERAFEAFDFNSVSSLSDEAIADFMRRLLIATGAFGASDLHLSTGAKPFIRQNRSFAQISDTLLSSDDALRLNTALLTESQRKTFLDKKDYDYALALDLSNRYRVNLMFHKQGAAGAYRMVPAQIKSLADLGFTSHLETIRKLLSYHNGLILVTGPVGAGKTTTLASLVSYLNESREDHIITVEDPVEVVQVAKGCNVSQREVGTHTRTFFSALKGALREDPDIIVIGELRDLETIEMAVSASETGHLVIGTMHTSDASTTLNRLLDVFPPAQQTQIRSSVAESLRGVICQRLLPATDGGLVLACEVLINNTAIANLIREGKMAGLRNSMETSIRDGMCLMDNAVMALYQDRKVSAETALANIGNRVLRAKIS